MPAVRPAPAVQRFLALRRSAGKLQLRAPGPDASQMEEILRVAARVPDHRRLAPWRFVLIEGEGRAAFGTRLRQIAVTGGAGDPDEAAGLMLRAPMVVAVIASPREDGRTPEWEQTLSAGAACYNLLLAANAIGFAGVWLTEWIAYDARVGALLGLEARERIAGFIYLGTPAADPQERLRPDLASRVSRWQDTPA